MLTVFIAGIRFQCESQTQPDRNLGVLIEAGSLVRSNVPDYVTNGRRLRFIGLKHFSDFSVGVGFGLDGYYANNTAPLFLDFRYYKLKRIVPFLTVGNAMNLGPEFDHGLMWNSGVMINPLPNKPWLKTAFGYNYQKVQPKFLDRNAVHRTVSVSLIFSLWN